MQARGAIIDVHACGLRSGAQPLELVERALQAGSVIKDWLEIGETYVWATRDASYFYIEARVLAFGDKKVKVEFVDDEYEGTTKWVPYYQLRAKWEDAWEFREHARVAEAAGNALRDALRLVFETLVPETVAIVYARDISVFDANGLADLSGLPIETISVEDLTFEDAERVAEGLVHTQPNNLLRTIEHEENEARYEAVRKAYNSSEVSFWWAHLDDQEQRDRFADNACRFLAPRNAIIRRWAGGDAISLADENRRLRRGFHSISMVADRAINGLAGSARTKGAQYLAAELRRDFDRVRIEGLRQENANDIPLLPGDTA